MANELVSGIIESCRYDRAIKVLFHVKSSHKPLIICIILTGGVLLGSIVMYTLVMNPILKRFPKFDRIFSMAYYVLWLYPVYATCFIFNTLCYPDIAQAVYRATRGQPKSPALSFTRAIACEIHRAFIIGVYVILTSLIALIPYSDLFIIVLMSWLYSFYCFEYRWVFEGRTISKEIKKLEQNAVYYLGFGLPFALITYSFPGLIGNGIWALLFPLFMVTALLSKTPTKVSRKIPVFTIPSYICDRIEIMLSSKKT